MTEHAVAQLCRLVVLALLAVSQTRTQFEDGICPPQELILPCRCSSRGTEIQIWCSHSDLPRVLAGVKNVAHATDRQIDELILENNYLPSLPGRTFSPLRIVRLMLRHNGLQRLSSGWLLDLGGSLVEVFIVERELRSIPADSLYGLRLLEAVTIHSENLKRAPEFSGLQRLRYISIQSNSLIELSAVAFRDLPSLETVHVTGSRSLNRLEAGLFQDLPRLIHLDLSQNGIDWIHLRSLIGLQHLLELNLSSNQISQAGMVGRAIKDLIALEKLKLDHNLITVLIEGSFVDLPSLKEIRLNNNAITEIHYGAFHRTPNLKVVHMDNNYIRRVHPESFLQSSGSGVEIMHLQNNDMDRIEELRSLLDALPMLRFLDMSDNRLTDVPYGTLRGHGSIEQLYLDNNQIRLIEQDAFMAMPALRELRLRNNTLSDLLPMPFWNLPGLKGLDLAFNRFRRLEAQLLSGIPMLRRLDISGNALSTVDPSAFSFTPVLETLNISNNDLASFHPATFRDLDRLFEIDAGFNHLTEMIPGLPRVVERIIIRRNKIGHLTPDSLNLPNLRMLDIDGNLIQKIPRSIFENLPDLRILNLARNEIQTIDEGSFTGLERLEILNLQDNQIVSMHERSMSALEHLRELNLQGNRIEVLVDHVLENLVNLERADFSRNNLVEISHTAFRNAKFLQFLDLSGNQLRELPQSLASLSELKELDISFNQLTGIAPDMIASWRSLEELRASNNKIPILQRGSFRSLPLLQYLDLSSNELNLVEEGALRNLPELQEVVLADNKLVEIPERSFEDLPNLQAVHLQQNYLRGISANAFFHSPSVVYLNLSMNHFKNLENAGLRSVRNLEVLDLSNNGLKRVLPGPLRGLDWLVELKLDNNRICGIRGDPFATMPRLRVLSMRNNRMTMMPEPTFRHLRTNIAILDVDGNPLDCSCELLWLRAWLQETDTHYPGPRCQDGTMLRETRLSRSDCLADARSNRVPGDVFNDRSGGAFDGCESDSLEHYPSSLPPSPVESDYFYDQYVDYPNELNETFLATSNHSAPVNLVPADSNRTEENFVDFNKNKFNNFGRPPGPPPLPPQSNSPFTFFGVPIPSIGNIFGSGRNAKQHGLGGGLGSRGKGRVQVYRPGDPELTRLLEQKGVSVTPDQTVGHSTEKHDKRDPVDLFTRPYFQTPFLPSPPQTGFTPMLPGSEGGFTPIHSTTPEPQVEKAEKVTDPSTEHPETTTPAWFSTFAAKNSNSRIFSNVDFTSSSTERVEPHEETTKNEVTTKLQPSSSTTLEAITLPPTVPSTPPPPPLPSRPEPGGYPSFFGAGSTFNSAETYDSGPSSLSALVAPGAQQGIYRKSTITKVFTPTPPRALPEDQAFPDDDLVEGEVSPPAPSLDSDFGGSNEVVTQTYYADAGSADFDSRRQDMDWYFSNYNKTALYDFEPDLNPYKSGGAATVAGRGLGMVAATTVATSVRIVIEMRRGRARF